MNLENFFSKLKEEQRNLLTESESKEILKGLGISTTQPFPVSSGREAVRMAESIGFPVVLKAESPKILHKSDVGGVRIGLRDEKTLCIAYRDIWERTHMIDNKVKITVQKMVEDGIEVIIGIIRDQQFGHAIMFGVGGFWVELFNDITFRIIPIDLIDADEMINEIKSQKVFSGFRGVPPANKEKIKDVLVRVSEFISKSPQIEEMDLNPAFALQEDVVVADARIILGNY